MESESHMVSAAYNARHGETAKDETYYFNLVTFKVENCLFRVPKHKFEQDSHVFQDMFVMPGESQGEEGTTDDKPIHLEGIQKEAFKLLLSLLYPQKPASQSSLLSLEQCISLLELTRMWGFDKIRASVMRRIRTRLWNDIEAVRRVHLVHTYEITEWYADAYCELAARKDPISLEEGQSLGLEFTVKMAQVREAGQQKDRVDWGGWGSTSHLEHYRPLVSRILLDGDDYCSGIDD